MSNPILNYASRLLPTFKRDRIEEDGRILATELAFALRDWEEAERQY